MLRLIVRRAMSSQRVVNLTSWLLFRNLSGVLTARV